MKFSNLPKLVGVSALAMSLTIVSSLATSAQTSPVAPPADPATTGAPTDTAPNVVPPVDTTTGAPTTTEDSTVGGPTGDPLPQDATLDTTPFQETEDEPSNWGWLGLVGLLGLLNLLRKRKAPVRYSETGEVRSSSTRY